MTLIRSLSLAAGVAGLSVLAFAQDGLPTQKVLTIDVAHTIAQEAMANAAPMVTR